MIIATEVSLVSYLVNYNLRKIHIRSIVCFFIDIGNLAVPLVKPQARVKAVRDVS